MPFHSTLDSFAKGKAHKKLFLSSRKGLFVQHPTQPSHSIKELQSGSNDNDSHVQLLLRTHKEILSQEFFILQLAGMEIDKLLILIGAKLCYQVDEIC